MLEAAAAGPSRVSYRPDGRNSGGHPRSRPAANASPPPIRSTMPPDSMRAHLPPAGACICRKFVLVSADDFALGSQMRLRFG